MIHRQIFQVNTDTGTWGDTGPSFNGSVLQMRWNPTTGDTGGDLQVALLPREDDTGDGFQFFSDNDCLGANFQRVPLQPVHGSDGSVDPADTGAQVGVPVVAAGDRLRVKIIPGGAAVVGRLYIWTGD